MAENIELSLYMAGGNVSSHDDYEPTQENLAYMAQAIELGKASLARGNSPIGSVLVYLPTGETFEGMNTEFEDDDLRGHPEQNAYDKARGGVGRDLSQCELYTTAEPCVGCTYMIDKGNLGTLFIAARRRDVPDFFRGRTVGMSDILKESRRSFTVVSGLLLPESKELLTAENGVHKRHP